MEDVDLRERLKAAGYAIKFVRNASVDHPPRRGYGLKGIASTMQLLRILYHRQEQGAIEA